MRKTSQDGGDATSITSGIENEIKKPGGIMKTKRNSIKRKVQNFSHESDDTVIEPLLQKDKPEKSDTPNQSAKFNILSKAKTEVTTDRGSDKDILILNDKSATTSLSNVPDNIVPTASMKETTTTKFTSATAPIHNHMNTNVFSIHDASKGFSAPKTQILVEIDGSKQSGYSPSPLIFTTAKIHTDGKTKHMEPVQMTPVPILSTIEVSLLKSSKGETSGLVNSNISTMYANIPKSNVNIAEKDPIPPIRTMENTPTPPYIVSTKLLISSDKTGVSSFAPVKTTTPTLATNDTKIIQPKLSSDGENKSIEKDKDLSNISIAKSSMSNETKISIPYEPKKNVAPVTTKNTSINNPSKSEGVINQTVAIAKNKMDDLKYSEKKTDLNDKSNILDNVKLQRSDIVKTTADKNATILNASVSSRQLQRQNIVVDKDDSSITLEPDIASSSESNNITEKVPSTTTKIKSLGNDVTTLGDKIKSPNICANNIPITSIASVTTTAAAAVVNKISTSITTTNALNKSPSPIITTAAVNKSSVPVTNIVSDKKTTVSVTNTLAANKSSTPITTTPVVSKLPASRTNTTNVTKSSGPATTVGDNKISASLVSTAAHKNSVPINTTLNKTSAPVTTTTAVHKVSASIPPSTTVKKTSTSNPISSVKVNTPASSSIPTNTHKSKSVAASTSSTEPSTTGKKSVTDATNSGGAIKLDTTTSSSTTKSQITSAINTKPLASTISTKTKVSTNPSIQPNAAIKSPMAITTKSVTASTMSKAAVGKSVDNTKESFKTSNGKPSSSKSSVIGLDATASPGVTNISTTTTSLDSSASTSSKKSDSKSNELSNGSKSLKA